MTDPPTPSPGPPPEDGRTAAADRPRVRRTAAALLGAEGVLLAAVAAFMFSRIGSADPGAGFAASLGAFILVFALALALAARSLLRRGRFGMGYGLTWQLFQALIGASVLRGGMVLIGVLTLVLAIVSFVLLTQLVRSTPLPYDRDGRS